MLIFASCTSAVETRDVTCRTAINCLCQSKIMTRIILGDLCLEKAFTSLFTKICLHTLGHVTKFVYKSNDESYTRRFIMP